jgi:subtilisin family serine protease
MNNHIGVAGVAPDVMIMPLKALSQRGVGRDSTVARAIKYAADHGAWVINMSFGGKTDAPVLSDAVKYASDRGVALVVAAGNDGRSAPSYPAATVPAIAVAATNVDDARPSYSNYGNWIHLAAPGQSIISTYWDETNGSSYRSASGTSMAAPHVAGVVALMLSIRPDLSVSDIDTVLKATADQVGGTDIGAGRVNAARAVKAVSSGGPIPVIPTNAMPPPTPSPSPSPTPTLHPTPGPIATAFPSGAQPGAPRTAVPTQPMPRTMISGGAAPR